MHTAYYRYLSLALLLVFSFTISASEEDKFAPVLDTINTCVACHGEKGASTQPMFPILAGQELYYLYLQLRDFKSGARKNEIMAPIASPLEKDEMMLIAEYFSEQQWPAIEFEASTEKVNAARQAINAGQCVACHLGGFEGNSRVPRAAGQYSEYLNKTLLEFKNKVRTNSPAKNSLFATFSDEDIKALADYLAGLKPE
jgi:cytochrome c553